MPDSEAINDEEAQAIKRAQQHELRVTEELNTQFEELRDQSRAVFAAVKGRQGIRTDDDWQEKFRRANVDYSTGRFLIEQFRAERYLDPNLMAILTHLRSELLAGIERPSASDNMMADSAVIAYRNMLRVQRWIGSLCLVVERELFGEAPLNEIHGPTVGDQLALQISRLDEQLMPLLDRSHRMMTRSLAHFDRVSKRATVSSQVTVGQTGQVNVGSAVKNESCG